MKLKIYETMKNYVFPRVNIDLIKSFLLTGFIATTALITSCGDDDGNIVDAPEGSSNVRLVEVDATNNEVTLQNFGDADQDLTGYWFCIRRNYGQFSLDATNSTDLILSTGESITFSVTVNDEGSDVSIYSTDSFTSSSAMIDFMQFNGSFTDNGRENVAVEKGIWTAGEFVEGSGNFTYDGDGEQNGASQWEGDPVVQGESNVRIVSVDPINDIIKLKNFGDGTQDLSGYFFCMRKSYPAFSGLTPVDGDLTLDPDEEVEFEVSIDDESSDVAIYSNNSAFADASNMVDFMQFGDAVGTDGRSDVAEAAGIWTVGQYVNGVGPFEYNDETGIANGAGQWTPSEDGAANVRLFSVDAGNDRVVLKNYGNASVNMMEWYFCYRKIYTAFSSLTPTSGNLILAPGEEAEFEIAIDDVSSDVGLYLNNSGFANPANILDFMQYGDAIGSSGRSDVAESAGLWTIGQYVNGVGPYSYGDETGAGNGVEQWSATEDGSAKVRLFSVDASNDHVTLKNYGNASVNMMEWYFCYRKVYTAFSSLTPTSGNLILAPGEEAEFEIAIDDVSSDVGLYLNNSGFANPANILDFMQYGDAIGSSGRSDVAESAGLWTIGQYVNGVGPYSYGDETGAGNGVEQWSATEEGSANIRLFTVNASDNAVILKNFGNASQNISDWFFCYRKVYTAISGLTPTSGNLILAPGEEAEFTITINDTSSDVGLYLNSSFTNPSSMLDFMQFGEDVDSDGRENVAVSAGIWTENEFVPNPGPFIYGGSGTENGASAWNQ